VKKLKPAFAGAGFFEIIIQLPDTYISIYTPHELKTKGKRNLWEKATKKTNTAARGRAQDVIRFPIQSD
jgi:hypothetical protein